ncbi:Asp23/Gls24 family envelope stress response protein [Vagococcus fluvialis]|uniref:Stress response regulator gls24 homolog n=1 Tax=Vagococcus fluvialis TaxID=2738 RepID=A0A369AZ22_9ENTE|nr:Asp23/Gls24 family envelope stress response protein [Vagococcus fluvialis]MBO0479380.1 Asp23/Gls24 family envelope stress response protein [Vagococcus fluvialis]MBO0483774.1 Asp23/Gls24 family envelope stress response protein [Vagococcus fluvialis]MCM2139378.1 Asp23/Gls24 family envelope stress response protein [Vagococcus fluvialis]MDT2747540.1 Asp23/Gls24 family envelope stress response protein [Vagococcus fluvialis]MDT2780640.1 Asp23/Gls24 family envelope stress response protein [Vagococ
MENKGTQVEVKKSELKGELTFEDKVIQKIVGISLETIPGLLTINGGFFSNLADKIANNNDVTSGIDVEVGKKEVAVDLDIVAEYGVDISKIYEDIKRVIEKEVKHMTSLEVIEVNVNVVDIKTKEQYEEDSVTVQDKLSDATSEVSDFVSDQTDKVKKVSSKGATKVKEATEPRVE